MVTTQYAKALPGWKVNAVDPGYTATDLNDHSGHKTVAEGARAIVAMARVDADGPTGGFFDDQGPGALVAERAASRAGSARRRERPC